MTDEILTIDDIAVPDEWKNMNAKPKKERREPERLILEQFMASCPQVSRLRWKQTVLERLAEFDIDECERKDAAAEIAKFTFIPDAFAVYPETNEIHFFEVEITSLMPKHKLQAYAKLVTDMDSNGIELALFTLNQHAHMNHVYLLPHYLEWALSEASQS